jgi:hypothetical protein
MEPRRVRAVDDRRQTRPSVFPVRPAGHERLTGVTAAGVRVALIRQDATTDRLDSAGRLLAAGRREHRGCQPRAGPAGPKAASRQRRQADGLSCGLSSLDVPPAIRAARQRLPDWSGIVCKRTRS